MRNCGTTSTIEALSNDRLVSLHDGQVTCRWKDRAHGCAPRAATVEAETFLRIRPYGGLANSARKRLLPTVRGVLGLSAPVACTPPPVLDAREKRQGCAYQK
jgi:hypothetical protein